MASPAELKAYIEKKFCEQAGLTPEVVFGENLTLAQLISRSERMTNSVDLMEAFAKTSNALRKDYGVRARLPALSLETPVAQVMEVFLREVARQQEQTK